MSLPVSELTPQSPWLLRWRAYLKERFPLMAQVLLIISYYSSNQFLAQVLLQPQQPIHYSLRSLLGGITLLCFFFHLRVFDEHKDFKEDCKYFPQRVLQRGIITLKELRIIGGLAIAWELVVGFLLGPAVFVAVVIALGYSLLMLKEFFLKNWLKKKFLIYASVHMMIMPLLAVMIFSFVTHRYPWEAPSWYWLYAWVGFFVCFNWEISRKIRSPEQEIEGVDSYTKLFGTYGAAYMVLMVRLIDTAMVFFVGLHLNLSIWFYGVLILLYLVCVFGFVQYRLKTTPKTAKRMEFYAGMYIVAFDFTLAIAIITNYGMEFPELW